MTILAKLDELGQSIWYDNIQRSQLIDGSLQGMIDQGIIKGVTSNPSIFQKSISSSSVYDETLKPMAWSGLDSESIFWQLAAEDIQKTTDLFQSLYINSGYSDGFVSLEVSPFFAHDTASTVAQAKALWHKVDRGNLMIKIPATREGIPAIREAIAYGINVNVTLIFSLRRYEEVMDAYLSGLEDRLEEGKPIDRLASVASFFISRVDTKIDGYLFEKVEQGRLTRQEMDKLAGRAAVANARMAYALYEQVVSGERFKALAQQGARMQRPLWASTSTKNPLYRDVVYIEELIGQNTVNTVPPTTLAAYLDHGKAERTIHLDLESSRELFEDLVKAGIQLDNVTDELETEGVKAFSEAFTGLLASIEQRRLSAIAELTGFHANLSEQVRQLREQDFIARFYKKDASLWTSDDAGVKEIHNRMNWVNAPMQNQQMVPALDDFREECRARGYENVVVLGMGGSSLAPEVFSLMFMDKPGKKPGLAVTILDSTDPVQVSHIEKNAPVKSTLFIVASKSGTTGEINAFSEYFWDQAVKEFGVHAGDHFAVITDPGSPLENIALQRGYLKIFAGDPQVGGRYSALTAFGLVPAALSGVNIQLLLENASRMAGFCSAKQPVEANPGLVLGAYIGSGSIFGRNKLTILTDPDWAPFSNWLEQLIAESSGKIGKGITPVVNEPLISAQNYANDRLFVYLKSTGKQSEFITELRDAGQPVLTLEVGSPYDLGSQFYLWEVATPVACSIIGVNVFDQPDVQDAKTRTLQSLSEYKRTGKLVEPEASIFLDDIRVTFSKPVVTPKGNTVSELISSFLEKTLQLGDYVGINAFLPMTSDIERKLSKLRLAVLDRYKVATMLGFGPRFLHSTGQLHKGGPDEGVFIVFTARRDNDLQIPGEGVSFDTLQRAQALGDMDALRSRNRRMVWIDLPDTGDSLSKIL